MMTRMMMMKVMVVFLSPKEVTERNDISHLLTLAKIFVIILSNLIHACEHLPIIVRLCLWVDVASFEAS